MSEFATCPSEKMLIDFASQSLNADAVTAVSLHLEECQPCCEAVEWIKCHLLRPIDDDESDLTGIGLHSPGEEPPSHGDAAEPDSQIVDFDFSVLEKSIVEGAIGRLGKYDLLGIIGKGGMGIVFKAWDERLRRTVAIKVLKRGLSSSPTSTRRFLREARAAAAISHAHVVTIHAVDEHRGIPFLVMEFINGHSLRTAIKGGTRLDFPAVLRLSAQIASGLEAAHGHGVIHRDIKPGNIMLEETVDRAKITDFGLARACIDKLDQTSCEIAVGTPAYMSPEQIAGETVDYRSDLFGLGCLFYEMVAGRSPFQGRSTLEVARKLDSFTPEPLHVSYPQVPRFFSDVVARLLEKEPERRYQSAKEVADLLSAQLHSINQPASEQLPAGTLRPDKNSPDLREWSFSTWAVAAPVVLAFVSAFVFFVKPFDPLKQQRAVGNDLSRLSRELFANVRPERRIIEVARSGSSEFSSLTAALQSITQPSTIVIQDDLVYEETLLINDSRWDGLEIHSPLGATIKSLATDTLLTVDSVSNVTLSGLRFLTNHSQHALEIKGQCPGLKLNKLTVSSPAPNDKTAIFFNTGATATSDRPVVVEDCVVQANTCVAIIGHPFQPSEWIRFYRNRFQGNGPMRDGVGLVLHADVRNTAVENNTFYALRRGVSLAAGSGEHLENVRIRKNAIFKCDICITVQDERLKAGQIEISGNYIANVPGFELSQSGLDAQWAKWFIDNVWEVIPEDRSLDRQRAALLAELREHIPFVSRDPNNPEFLKVAESEATKKP